MRRLCAVLTVLAMTSGVSSAREWFLFHDGGKGEGWTFAGTQYSTEHPQGGHLHMKHVVVWSGEEKDVFGNNINRFGVIGADQDIGEIAWETAYLEFHVDTHGVVIPDVRLELHIRGRRGSGLNEFHHKLATLGSGKPGYERVRVPLKKMARSLDHLLGTGRRGRVHIFLMNTVNAPVGTVIEFDEVKIVDGVAEPTELTPQPPPKFVSPPRLTDVASAGGRINSAVVSFELDQATDCIVRIVDGNGKVVRHLAAGLLGPRAPAPFAADALAQKIPWDGTDDDGEPLPPGTYTLTVSAKMTPKLGAFLGEDTDAYSLVHPVGIQVDPKGNVYLLHRAGVMHQSPSHVYVYDREGRYQREILPPNPNVAPDYAHSRQRSNATGSVPSWANRFETAMLAYVPPGHLFALGMDHGGSDTYPVVRRLVRLGADGQSYREYGNTPFWVPKHWNLMWLCPTSATSMLISDGAPRGKAEAEDARPQAFATKNPTCYHVVVHCLIRHRGPEAFETFTYAGRRKLDAPRSYLGTLREAGDDAEHFNGPAGVAVDADGRIFVCDSGNHKIKVFRRDGYYLRSAESYEYNGQELPLTHCAAVLVDPHGFIYVTVDAQSDAGPVKRLVKLHPVHPHKTIATVDLHELAGFNLALDTSRKPFLLWTTKGAGTGTFTRIEVHDDRFGKVTHFGGRKTWKLMQVTSIDVDENEQVYCVEKSAVYQRVVRLDGRGGGTFEVLERWPRLRTYGSPADVAGEDKVPYLELGGGYNSFVNRLVLTPDGAMVYNHGQHISRFDRRTGAPLNFRAGGKPSVTSDAGDFRLFRGCAVDREGNIYTLTHTKRPDTGRGAGWNRIVGVFGPDGASKNKDLLGRIPGPMRDLDVDRTGCVWLFTGQKVYRYRPGEGRLWEKDAFSYSRYDGCGCMTPKLCVDGNLYAFVPDEREVRVRVMDSAGNVVTDVGAYGNRDCRGRFGTFTEPAIPLQNPIATAATERHLYIADYANLRIVRVDLQHALEGSVTFKSDGTVVRAAP